MEFEKLQELSQEMDKTPTNTKKGELLEYYGRRIRNHLDELNETINEAHEICINPDKIDENYEKIKKDLKTDKDFMNLFGPYMVLHSLVT